MKLTKKEIVETLRILEEGGTAYQARKISNISVRRVNQIYQIYKETGEIPVLGISVGRPKRPILEKEKIIIKEAYGKYRLSASRLRGLIRRDYNVDLPHYHIHKILLKTEFAKQRRRRM